MAQTQQSISVNILMQKLNLNESLQVVEQIRRKFAEAVPIEDFNNPIYISFTDPRALELINALSDQFQSTEIFEEADFYLNLDADQQQVDFISTEYDTPVIIHDLSEVVLAWETQDDNRKNKMVEDLSPVVTGMLQYIADDAEREGLRETPKRVAKAWAKWTEGYYMDAADILKVFEDGAENCDEMVIVKDIPIYSHCEHHLAAIFGTATIAYIPNGKIVGLSKLSRLADMYGRRLQVQERLTNQIADALEKHLQPLGVGVVIRARHMCMESRGVCQQGHHTITSALRGNIKDNLETRAEFMALANSTVTV